MKQILLFAILAFTVNAIAQIPTVKAVGGSGTNINWAEEKKKADAEPGFFYNDCAQGVTAVSASSVLAPQGKKNYDIKNLTDDDPTTAWVEGKTDYGTGEYFEIKSPWVNVIYNGYQSTPETWKNNSRVKKFKVYKNGKPYCFLELTDEMGAQHFELPNAENNDMNVPSVFKFEIMDVYKGAKWQDVAISHIDWVLCCFSQNTGILGQTGALPVQSLNNKQIIYTLDIENAKLNTATVQKITHQTHLRLLKIVTTGKQIEVTPDHPLYIKGYGFISLNKYLQISKQNDFTALVGKTEVLTWNAETNKPEFEIINKIEITDGVFDTYTILKLDKGEVFIANGFVTRLY